jgi:predicted phosphodiesterase
MKAQLISDIHTELLDIWTELPRGDNSALDFLKSDADVLVVAGDLTDVDFLEQNILYLCDMFPHVVFVAGNHEYYHSTLKNVDSILENLTIKVSNFHWLNDGYVDIEGNRFIGGTLWFPENHLTTEPMLQSSVTDFRTIEGIEDKFDGVYRRHERTFRYLWDNVLEGDIVVTHHLPSSRSTPLRFMKSLLNCYFVVDMEDMIRARRPGVWMHGHTHDACSYVIDKTLVLCNPVGYYHEEKTFEERLIIEV